MPMNAREFLRQYNLTPKQSLAQNFLVDDARLQQIAAAANLTATDLVLEVGPGPGTLTRYLAAQAGHVTAVELDDRLIEPLQDQFAEQPNVSVVHGDILKLAPFELVHSQLPPAPGIAEDADVPAYKVVANLPYYITSAVLRHLLESTLPPTLIVVLIQKEVAERICAAPGAMSILAVSIQYYAQPTLLHHIPATAFYPQPKVDSAVLRLDRLAEPAVAGVDTAFFFRVVRAGFSQKRKQLGNTLSAGLHLAKPVARATLEEAAIDPRRRAETLSLAEWGELCRILARIM